MFQDYLLKSLVQELSKCEDADEDLARLRKWNETFKDDSDFVAIMAGALSDANTFGKATMNHNEMRRYLKMNWYEEAGEKYAEIMIDLFGDIPKVTNMSLF